MSIKSKYKSASQTTFSVKVSETFARQYRDFCDKNCLQTGKFTEQALTEIMEDYYFGRKAQEVLARSSGKTITHQEFMRLTSER